MVWGIYALYERVSGRFRCPGGLSDPLASTIGVKQGCPLSPMLFGLYIDEIVDFIQQQEGDGIEVRGSTVHILLYADDIVLVSESAKGLQHHPHGLDDFCRQRGLSVNLGKTKVMIFYTSAQVRRHSLFTAAGGPIEVVGSYVYSGVTFTAASGVFSMSQAARDRITCGYTALALMERQCHQAYFQEPRTKGSLFDTLVKPALMYGAAIWGPGLATSVWIALERPEILMIARLIRSKPSVPHDIIRTELAAPPMLVEALFQTVCLLHRLRTMDTESIAYRAFQASRDMALAGDTSSWYAQARDWLAHHGFDIDRLPPLQYDLHAPTYSLSHQERNRFIRQEIMHTYIQRTWVSPRDTLPPKMLYYCEHFLHISDEGFIEIPRYMQTYLSHHLRVIIEQLRVSSHQLEIERGQSRGVPREERWCPVCQTEVESEEHFVIRCPAYLDLRAEFQIEESLQICMTMGDQQHLGRFLTAAYERRESLQPTGEYPADHYSVLSAR
ncbi:hypothetical protein KP509_22G076800 [Ceratopteris richardii]|uniref:Reverse transcriptase domain-containing protein n=1 Tax=Ceratopteris richardii TaxID=49495 RepID=A0A8T2S6H3_CERRI|nr:hypothetical protein KP509_22G076800 [Ceratopteris richardii]